MRVFETDLTCISAKIEKTILQCVSDSSHPNPVHGVEWSKSLFIYSHNLARQFGVLKNERELLGKEKASERERGERTLSTNTVSTPSSLLLHSHNFGLECSSMRVKAC